MKKLLLSAMFITAFLFYNETKAQVRFNVNLNIGSRPNWGLPGDYAGDYYYLPEIDCYYDIPNRLFVYFDGRNWAFAAQLPYAYRDYDLYRGFKVSINAPRPYLHCNVYRERYRSYYNTYRAPGVYVQRNPYPYDNDNWYGRGRDDERFERRRGYERDDRGWGNGRGNGHAYGRGGNRHDRDDD